MVPKGENIYARLCTDEWHNSGMQRPSNCPRQNEASADTGATPGVGYTVCIPIQQSYNQRLEDSLYRLGGQALVQMGDDVYSRGVAQGGETVSASDKQVGGRHYKDMAIQPSEFIVRNDLGWHEGNAIKYICRHHIKGGEKDIDKAIHYLELLKETVYERETGNTVSSPATDTVPAKDRRRGPCSGRSCTAGGGTDSGRT